MVRAQRASLRSPDRERRDAEVWLRRLFCGYVSSPEGCFLPDVRMDFGREDHPLTYDIIGSAIAVHKQLGPGLRESVYEEPFYLKLKEKGLHIRRQPRIRVPFEGRLLNKTFVPDFLVADEVVVEIKSVETIPLLHETQLRTYMKLGEYPLGLLINFNVIRLVDGVRRLINTPRH
jgi:GxxExxY protein